MIFGIGCDIVKIERFHSSCENQDFIKRFFSTEEIKAQEKKGKSVLQKAEYYAGRFACKEAFSKALGTGVRNFDLADISVLNDELGKPEFHFSAELDSYIEKRCGKCKVHLSLSHEKEFAIAYVVIDSLGEEI